MERCGRFFGERDYIDLKSEGEIMQLKLKKKEAPAAAPAAAAAPAGAAPAFAMPTASSSGGITIELRGASVHIAEVVIKPTKK